MALGSLEVARRAQDATMRKGSNMASDFLLS